MNRLIYWIIRRIFKYSFPIINLIEKYLLKNSISENSKSSKYQPIFIISPPRSGSTILYQFITNYFDVSYVDNLTHLSKESLLYGMRISNLVFGNSPHNSFESFHGSTIKSGLHAPNDKGLFWYKWLPKHKHFIGSGEMSPTKIKDMQTQIFYILNKFNKPIVFKNLNFSVRLQLIKEAFPNAKIIYVKRDPIYVVQSILLAREKENVSKNTIWSVRPREDQDLINMLEIELVVKQVFLINKQINNDLKLFDKQQILYVNYEDICKTKDLIESLTNFIGIKPRDHLTNIKIDISKKQMVSDDFFELIKKEIAKLDWDNYSSKL